MTGRWAIAALAGAVALALAAACGGGGQLPPTPTPTPKATQVISCRAIEDITSYRYLLRFQLSVPSFQPGEASPEGDVFGPFADVLLGLLSDIQIEGAFVAPDRSQALLRFQGQEVEVRTIGDQSWVRLGDVWQAETAPTEEVLLSPQTICQEIVPDLGQSLRDIPSTPATVNGLATRRYHLEEADLPRLSRLLGTEEDTALPEEFVVDVWLAQEGGWPVKLRLRASGSDEEGQPISLELFLEFRDINSPDIEIEAPEVAGGQA